jgi:hypothetical protein
LTDNVEARMQDTYKAATGTGWTTFAAIMFMISGVFHIIDGIAALAKNNQLGHYQLFWNLTFWGVVWLVVGALALYVGYALLSGSGAGRGIGIFLASLGIIAQLMFVNTNTSWALVMIAIWFMVIYALIVKGGESTA